MLNYILFICFVSTALSIVPDEEPNRIILLHDKLSQTHRDTAKLIYLINKLRPEVRSEDIGEGDSKNDGKAVCKTLLINTLLEDSIKEDQKVSMEELMRLIQKNYDAGNKFENVYTTEEVIPRTHFISNPEVLEAYKKDLKRRQRHYVTSDSDESSSEYIYSGKDDLGRRNAAVRNSYVLSEQQDSPEMMNIRHLKRNSLRTKNLQEVKRQPQIDYENHLNVKPLKIVTEDQYDKKSYGPEVKPKRFSKAIDRWDSVHQKHDNDVNFDMKDKIRKKGQTNERMNDDYVRRDKIEWGSDEKYGGGADASRKNKKNNDYNWNEKKEEKGNWDGWAVKDKVVKERVKNVQPKWSLEADTYNKNDGSFKKLDKMHDVNSWDKWTTKEFVMKKKKFTEKKDKSWKVHAPKSADYYYSKPKKVERSGGSSFGRTPIPFIGKRGIYED